MTLKQKENYNKMLHSLKGISKRYQTPDQLKRNSKKDFGLDYEEALEMTYESIQAEAKIASKGIKSII